MPENVPMTLLIEIPINSNSLESHFQDELIRCLDRNNVNLMKNTTPTTPYYIRVVYNYFEETTERETVSLDDECSQSSLTFDVPVHKFSLTITLLKDTQIIESWSYKQNKKGAVKPRILTSDPCDYRVKNPPSFETMLSRCARKARRQIANKVYSMEFK